MSSIELVAFARQHAANLRDDIKNAKDRMEHIRLTTLALEAERLATELENSLTASV
jgi:hypothetical protein